jgi:hypothetical protein
VYSRPGNVRYVYRLFACREHVYGLIASREHVYRRFAFAGRKYTRLGPSAWSIRVQGIDQAPASTLTSKGRLSSRKAREKLPNPGSGHKQNALCECACTKECAGGVRVCLHKQNALCECACCLQCAQRSVDRESQQKACASVPPHVCMAEGGLLLTLSILLRSREQHSLDPLACKITRPFADFGNMCGQGGELPRVLCDSNVCHLRAHVPR